MESKLIFEGYMEIDSEVEVPIEIGPWYKIQPGSENSPFMFRHVLNYNAGTFTMTVEKVGTSWLNVSLESVSKTTIRIKNLQERRQQVKIYRV